MTLFNEYEAMLPDARDFVADVEALIRPVVEDMLDRGARGRELSGLLHGAVDSLLAYEIVKHANVKRNKKLGWK